MLAEFIDKAKVGRSYTWAPVLNDSVGGEFRLPVILLKGVQDGPTLYVGAAIHGDELNGIGVIFKMLSSINNSDLRGRILFVPVQNPIAFQHRQRFVPGDIYDTYAVDVHTAFPGSATGQITECIADAVLKVILHADYAVDLHTAMPDGNYICHSFSPAIGAGENADKAIQLAEVFGTPIVVEMESGLYVQESMLHSAATKQGVPTIGAELGPGGCIDPDCVEIGYRGMINILSHLNMVEGEISKDPNQVIVDKVFYQRASMGGIIEHRVELGAKVEEGDEVAKIYDLHFKEAESIKAQVSGILYRQRTYPTANGSERVSGIVVPRKR
jgi:predicted deacylase